ncbi:MAG TPA: transposase [Gemmataceae bacterium]|nr:transposase [Gemmataceae bacterium]
MRTHKYPSDLTDEPWALVEPLIPVYPGGQPRKTSMRDVLDAIFYILRTGCPGRYLPKDFPPKSTVWGYFDPWRHHGTLEAIHDKLRDRLRQQEKPGQPRRTASIDRPSVDSSAGGRPAVGTTPRRSMAANALSSWTAWGCCWPWL